MTKDPLVDVKVAGTTSTGQDTARAPTRARSSILIVDDDAELARRYQYALESYGYSVDRVAQGDAAIRLANSKRFDLVVGDVDPREGREDGTLKRIHHQCKDVPMVLLSNFLAFASARTAAACGAYRYLIKPVSDERLLEVVVETIQESSRHLD